MEIYAPLAERLGIWQMKWELEDLAVQGARARARSASSPSCSTPGARAARATSSGRSPSSRRELEAAGIEADLQGRPKHIYSIWKKMQRKGAEFGEIYDVYAIRVLVDEVRDCYAALGIVHSLWRPIPGQFDDYIAVPKNNLYQSLHTAVIALDGKPLEIQIRTHAMHQVSRGRHRRPLALQGRHASPTASTTRSSPGCASSWTGSATSATRPSSSRASSSTSSRTRSSCSRPKGDIKDLPAGATPLDFAYRIHTDVGHRTIGAKVNNRLVPLDYRLKNGDIVEIVTTKGEHGPSRDWLNIVRTSHAREKIRQWFKRKERDENIVHGRESLERELRRLARTSIAGGRARTRSPRSPSSYNYDDARRLLRGDRLRRDQRRSRSSCGSASSTTPERRCRRSRRRSSSARTGGVRVKGVGDLLVRFAKCCHPIPGDPIVGFITRGKGVTVHLRSCPTVLNEREVSRADRRRVGGRADRRPTRSRSGSRRTTGPGLLSDITQVVAENKVNIVAAHGRRDARTTPRS